jgi:hypothetical protein
MSIYERTARCACGGLAVTTSGEPTVVYACSCLTCQRKSGSAFSYSAIFPETAVSAAGERKTWRHHADSGRWIESELCPTCGVTVLFRVEAWPGMVGVSIGCFADPEFAEPTKFYWGSRRHRWLHIPDGIELQETQSD